MTLYSIFFGHDPMTMTQGYFSTMTPLLFPVQQEAALRTALSDLDMDGVSKRLPRKWRRTFRDGSKTVRDRMNELDSMTCMLTKASVVLRQVGNGTHFRAQL